MPARRGAWAIYQTFETAEGELLFLGITGNSHFRALRGVRPARPPERPASCEECGARRGAALADPEIQSILAQRGRPSWSRSPSGRASGVAKPADLIEHPHLLASGGLLDVLMPNGARTRLPRLPIELAGH